MSEDASLHLVGGGGRASKNWYIVAGRRLQDKLSIGHGVDRLLQERSMKPERTGIKMSYIIIAIRNREQGRGPKRLRRRSTERNTEMVGNLFSFTVFIWKKTGIIIDINVIGIVFFSTLHDWIFDIYEILQEAGKREEENRRSCFRKCSTLPPVS